MGLAFLLNTKYQLPLTVVALVVAVGALGFRATRRRGYGPFLVGLVSFTVLLVGKFVLVWDMMIYGGVGLLIAASVWNAWPRRQQDTTSNLVQLKSLTDSPTIQYKESQR